MHYKHNGQRSIWPTTAAMVAAQVAFSEQFEVRHKLTHKRVGTLTVLKGKASPPSGCYLVSI